MLLRALPLLLIVLIGLPVYAAEPLRALLLTSPGVYHNYQYQSRLIAGVLARYADARTDVSLAELDRWRDTDFSNGYDLLVYNICMADNTDQELIANLKRQTEILGVPALVLHCTMHSFRTTQLWWPFYGLKTVAHEPLRPMPQAHATEHPLLTGIPPDWRVDEDELYINLAFDAEPILQSEGADGATHVTAWFKAGGQAPVFGTTLGHTNGTLEDPVFQRLLVNAALYLTGQRGAIDTVAIPTEATVALAEPAVTAPEGVRFLGEAGMACVRSEFRDAAGACYIGCSLHPLKWGADADACRKDCQSLLPSPDEVAVTCMPVSP